MLSVDEVRDLEDDGETLYVVVRENVIPVKDFPIDREILRDLDDALYTIEERQAYSEKESIEASRTVCELAPHIGTALKELLYHGHRLVDLESGNVGLTIRPRLGIPEGSLIMFDISFEEKDDG